MTAGSPATVDISGLTIRDGAPQGGTAGGGGILFNGGASSGTYRLSDCEITGNDATAAGNPLGGGIDNEGGVVSIERCAIVNNTATFRGGAIQNQGFGSMKIVNSTIAGNTAGPTGIGGAVRTLLPLTFVNCTIVGNSAQSGGNISRSGGTVDLQNTIVGGGVLIGTGGASPDLDGAVNSLDFNLIQDTAGATIGGATTHNITGVSPLVGALADNGGPTRTMALQAGSPAIDAGGAATDPIASTALVVDQRGNPRPVDARPAGGAGNASDIGAFEVQTPVVGSGPTAEPNPAVAGLAVTFGVSATADGDGQTLTYAWDFGDGSNATGATPSHTFTTPGVYSVVVTIDDGLLTTSKAVGVTIFAPPIVGSGNDSDGDGFSDDFEGGAQTDPNDSASTPTGSPITAAAVVPLVLSGASITLKFAHTGADVIRFGGRMVVPAGLAPANTAVLVDVGGVFKRFVLNAKGRAVSGSDRFSVKVKSKKGVVPAQLAKFTAVFAKGTFAPALADEGLTGDADVKRPRLTSVGFVLVHGAVVSKVQRDFRYTAKRGKVGRAK